MRSHDSKEGFWKNLSEAMKTLVDFALSGVRVLIPVAQKGHSLAEKQPGHVATEGAWGSGREQSRRR